MKNDNSDRTVPMMDKRDALHKKTHRTNAEHYMFFVIDLENPEEVTVQHRDKHRFQSREKKTTNSNECSETDCVKARESEIRESTRDFSYVCKHFGKNDTKTTTVRRSGHQNEKIPHDVTKRLLGWRTRVISSFFLSKLKNKKIIFGSTVFSLLRA
jgi:hypothetical protein